MSVNEIDLTVSAVQPIALTVEPDQGPVPMTMEQVRVIYDSPYPEYTGPTTVTPQARSDVVLDTSGKLMTDDVTVFEIPYYETTNPAGGYTAIIGG